MAATIVMLVLGHTAAATLTTRWVDRTVDLRWVIFLTLLADLIDKPVGLVIFRDSINNGRIYFHSLLVNLLLTVALLAFRKPFVYPLALWMHQLCDRMWMRPWVALWPFTGAFSYRDLPLDAWVYSVVNPYNVVTEVIGLAVMTALVLHYRLHDRRRLRAWVSTGRLPARTATSAAAPEVSAEPSATG